MENNRVPEPSASGAEMERYLADIEFSNSCRQFYISRLQATEVFKHSLCYDSQHTPVNSSMFKLRYEMASLMDQDLSLMKQLLTLNEAIQDLKAGGALSKDLCSVHSSSRDLASESEWSVSETDMYGTDNEQSSDKVHDVENMSVFGCTEMDDSGCSDCSKYSNQDRYSPRHLRKISEKIYKRNSEVTNRRRVFHGAQDSIDSGYSNAVYSQDMEVTV